MVSQPPPPPPPPPPHSLFHYRTTAPFKASSPECDPVLFVCMWCNAAILEFFNVEYSCGMWFWICILLDAAVLKVCWWHTEEMNHALIPARIKSAVGHTQSCLLSTRCSFAGGRVTGVCKAATSPPFSAYVKNEQCYIYPLLHTFMECTGTALTCTDRISRHQKDPTCISES